jgi:hypothetical protein
MICFSGQLLNCVQGFLGEDYTPDTTSYMSPVVNDKIFSATIHYYKQNYSILPVKHLICSSTNFWARIRETIDRSFPCVETGGEWGLKEYKSKGTYLGWFVGLFVPVQDIFVLPWLLSAHYKIFFFHRTIFQFLCPHRPASSAGSRAGPPFS